MDNSIKQIIEELENDFVEDIYFNTVGKSWLVICKPEYNMPPSAFSEFSGVWQFLTTTDMKL